MNLPRAPSNATYQKKILWRLKDNYSEMFILLAAQNTNWLFYHPKIPLGVRNLSFLRNLSVFKKPSKIKGTNVITITNLIDVY